MSLLVRESGLFSLLVERRRTSSRSVGVPVGGPADAAALALGNALVGNEAETLALEIALAGPTLEALHPTAAVVFGAPFQISIDNSPVESGTTFALATGARLKIGGAPTGARGYLCVAGGFDGPMLLDSRSALAPLRGGEELPCRPSQTLPRGLPFVDSFEGKMKHDVDASFVLRVLSGPQRDWFDDTFFSRVYEVTPASDRMGVRLRGEPLSRRPGELVSEAVAPGAVQVTNDGQPVVLGVDGQTIGGYPKVAHVIRADLDCLGQLRPRDRVRFAQVTWEEAEAAAHARAAFVSEWIRRLRAADRAPTLL